MTPSATQSPTDLPPVTLPIPSRSNSAMYFELWWGTQFTGTAPPMVRQAWHAAMEASAARVAELEAENARLTAEATTAVPPESDIDDRRPVQLRLGELIDLLEKRPADQQVYFDFGCCVPDGVRSYRGYYDQLAIDYEDEPKEWPTVAKLLVTLKAADGATFTGYKGGEYCMDSRTPLWVSHYGRSSNTIVVGVTGEYQTVILTAYQE